MGYRNKARNLIKVLWAIFVTVIVLLISGFINICIGNFAIMLLKVGYGYTVFGIFLLFVDAVYIWFIIKALFRYGENIL